jgi:hypothetical protein
MLRKDKVGLVVAYQRPNCELKLTDACRKILLGPKMDLSFLEIARDLSLAGSECMITPAS